MTKRGASRQWLIRLILGLIALLVFICSWSFFAPLFLPRLLAERLAPALYPGSRFIGENEDGGVDLRCHARTYQTADDVPTVLFFMEYFMPGFTRSTSEEMPGYVNAIEDQSWLATTFGSGEKLFLFPPSVQVWLLPLAADESGTKIIITTCWAAP